MVQSISVVVFLAGELLGNAQVVRVTVVMLWVSLALALLSAFESRCDAPADWPGLGATMGTSARPASEDPFSDAFWATTPGAAVP